MSISSCWVMILPKSIQLDIQQELFNELSLNDTLDTPDKLNKAIDDGMNSRLESLEEIINIGHYVEKLTKMGWTFENRHSLENN